MPRRRTVFALTADHGMASYPEYAVAVAHRPAGRMSLAGRVQHENTRLRERYGTDFELAFDNGILTGEVGAMRARGLNVDSIADGFAAEIQRLPGVAEVFAPAQLALAPASDADAGRWKRNLPPGVEWLVVAVAKPGYVFSDKLTGEHGTMLPETVAVPIAFMGVGIRPGTYTRVVRTVDIGPTLAQLLGVRPTEQLDGVSLVEMLSGGASATPP